MTTIVKRSALLMMFAACQQGATTGASSPASTDHVQVSDVQAAIAAQNAGWVAGHTSMSDLAPAQVKHHLGNNRTSIPPHITLDAVQPTATLPAVFDWRDQNGVNYVSPILDQGDCGSCVAFAATGTFETQWNIASGDTTSPFELSPEYVMECGGGSCDGWEGAPAAAYLAKTGMTDDACMPYTSGAAGVDESCNVACSNASSRRMKATTTTSPSSSQSAVKQALLNGPLMTAMEVYDDFMDYQSGVYKHVTGPDDGGHEVSIIGWNDNDQAWICRNSWGTGWGENGFFEIAYTDVSGVGDDNQGFTVAAPAAYTSLQGVRDGDIISGNADALTFNTKGMTDAAVTWTLTPVATATSGAGSNAISGATPSIDTTSVADGVYFLQSTATSGTSTVASEPRQVYVLNGTETGTINFTSPAANKTVSGVTTLELTATSAPIPLTATEFIVADANGNVEEDRPSEGNTGAKMEIDWDTTKHPNGVHTVTVKGFAGTQAVTPAVLTVNLSN